MNRRLLNYAFTLMNVDHVHLGERWNYQNVLSPYFRLYLIDDGGGTIVTSQGKWELKPGYLYIIPSFTLCDLRCETYMRQYFLHFFENTNNGTSLFQNHKTVLKVKAADRDLSNFKRLLELNPDRKINRSDNPKMYEKAIFYKEYENLNNKQDVSTFMETQGIIMQLVSRFLAAENFDHKNHDVKSSRIVDVIEHIQLNLSNDLSIAELATRVNLHPDHFSKLFLQLTGERPSTYINRKRVERAQFFIMTTRLSFTEIAEKTGFCNAPHLFKIFKKLTDLTPGQYRRQLFFQKEV